MSCGLGDEGVAALARIVPRCVALTHLNVVRCPPPPPSASNVTPAVLASELLSRDRSVDYSTRGMRRLPS